MNKIANEIETPKLAESTALKTDSVIKLSGISKKYNLYNNRQDRLKEALHPRRKIYHRDFYALKDINLEVKHGEVLGIVGKNGSGKSTLLKVISNILTPTAGLAEVKGKVVALLELGAGFNPEFTGIENIYFYCSLIGYNRQQTEEIIGGIIDFAELGDFVHQPIKTYSSGMKARLGFAVSVNVDPDILILDEVLSVGDELFRRKCYARMEEFFNGGKTILYVSHSVQTVNELCTRVILLDRGECILEGPAKMVTMYYLKYLHATGNKIQSTRQEIISLNKNEKLKLDIGESILLLETQSKINKNTKNNNVLLESNQNNKNGSSLLKPFFMPNFISKSRVEHKHYDVDITDIQITTLNGNKVNALVINENYIIKFQTKFNINVRDVFFGCRILSIKGLNISGLHSDAINKIIEFVNINDYYLTEFFFTCQLVPGTYSIEIGVAGKISNETVTLNRIADAILFKVLSDIDYGYTGICHLNQSVNIIKKDINK